MDQTLDELASPRERAIRRYFISSNSASARYLVYELRRDRSQHISVDLNFDDQSIFHATVGNYHYGFDDYGNEGELTPTGNYSYYDEQEAFDLFEFFYYL